MGEVIKGKKGRGVKAAKMEVQGRKGRGEGRGGKGKKEGNVSEYT